MVLAAKNRTAAEAFAEELWSCRRTNEIKGNYSSIAARLNELSLTTRGGDAFYPQTIKNCVQYRSRAD